MSSHPVAPERIANARQAFDEMCVRMGRGLSAREDQIVRNIGIRVSERLETLPYVVRRISEGVSGIKRVSKEMVALTASGKLDTRNAGLLAAMSLEVKRIVELDLETLLSLGTQIVDDWALAVSTGLKLPDGTTNSLSELHGWALRGKRPVLELNALATQPLVGMTIYMCIAVRALRNKLGQHSQMPWNWGIGYDPNTDSLWLSRYLMSELMPPEKQLQQSMTDVIKDLALKVAEPPYSLDVIGPLLRERARTSTTLYERDRIAEFIGNFGAVSPNFITLAQEIVDYVIEASTAIAI